MHRDRITTLVVLSFTLALGAAVSCTDSEPINPGSQTGRAGSNGSGAAGSTTGAAGSTTGAAGSASGMAGSTQGGAGSTGAAGSTTGGAGSTGAAGSTTGNAGSTGNAGAGGSGGAAGNGGAGGAGGAGGGAGGSSGGMLSFATDIFPFIKTQCTPCHITNTDGQLSMKDAPTAFSNLVGTNMMGVAAKTNLSCTQLDASKKRVVVGDPTHSFLYIKVSQTTAMLMPGGCQPAMPEMPQSNLTLTTDQVTKIHDWIMGGAKP